MLDKIKRFFRKLFKLKGRSSLPVPPMNIIVVTLCGAEDYFKILCEVDSVVRVHRTHDGWHCLTLKGFTFNQDDFMRSFFYTLEDAIDYITERMAKYK